ncbi:MAG: hypothetical protein IJT73_08550 [Selenomonadaceae bacterium]|nr:hypothetical protein [Selenomonadaceae bacterium]
MAKIDGFKPQISELIDLLNQQKNIAENLLEGSKEFDSEGKFIKAWQLYLEKLDEQDTMLFNLARNMEVSFENDLYKKIVK